MSNGVGQCGACGRLYDDEDPHDVCPADKAPTHPYLLDPEDRTVAEELDHLHMTVAVLALNIRAVADRIAQLQRRVTP